MSGENDGERTRRRLRPTAPFAVDNAKWHGERSGEEGARPKLRAFFAAVAKLDVR